MINLLPPSYATRIKYGRLNTRLRIWIIGALISIAGLILIFIGGWMYLDSQSQSLQKQLDTTNAQLKSQDLEKVKKDSAEITGDIKVINQILGSEIHFSKLIQDIGTVMPPNTALATLSLSGDNSGAIDLTANAVDNPAAAQIAVNLNDPANGLFSKVDIVDIIYKALFFPTALKKYQNIPGGSQ
jgi:Tfp pilus assembly protein PilN